MINSRRIASVALALGLGLASLPASGLAAPITDPRLRVVSHTTPAWAQSNSADPGVALIEAWAYVGDTLTKRQEKVANESYLATSARASRAAVQSKSVPCLSPCARR
jgi:hypothetical protein